MLNKCDFRCVLKVENVLDTHSTGGINTDVHCMLS